MAIRTYEVGFKGRGEAERAIHSFGIRDAKDREIGAHVYTRMIKYVAYQEGEEVRSWSTIPPGEYYGLCVWATRDGKTFGAVQHWQHFRTLQEREEAITKYLEGAKKRAAKKAV